MSVFYEWDVELVVNHPDGDNDIVEHYFQENYAGCVKQAAEPVDPDEEHHIVLVRTSARPGFGTDRAWAYMVDGKLPEYFEDAAGAETHKVPQRFHNEVAK